MGIMNEQMELIIATNEQEAYRQLCEAFPTETAGLQLGSCVAQFEQSTTESLLKSRAFIQGYDRVTTELPYAKLGVIHYETVTAKKRPIAAEKAVYQTSFVVKTQTDEHIFATKREADEYASSYTLMHELPCRVQKKPVLVTGNPDVSGFSLERKICYKKPKEKAGQVIKTYYEYLFHF